MMKKIELFFENEEGKTVKYTLDKPVEPVNPASVQLAMDDIIAQNVFNTSGGDLVTKKGARVVETIVEEIQFD